MGDDMSRIYDLKQREVINIKDGSRYGYVADVVINTKTGVIEALIVPGPARVLGMFGRDSEFHIPWCAIKQICDDLILVEADTNEILKEDK